MTTELKVAAFKVDLTGGLSVEAIDALTPNGDGSNLTVSVPGGTARKMKEIASDFPNIKSLGAKSDGSENAVAAFNEATAVAVAGGWVVEIPPGVYDLGGIGPGTHNVGYSITGTRFTNIAPTFPDWMCDPTMYSGASPRAWRALEGAVDRHDGQFGRYVAMRVLDTSSGGTDPSPGYMKGAGYFKIITHDKSGRVGASDPDTVTRDAVALTGAGTIAAGNTLGRAWGLFAHAICEAGADGLLAGLEIDMGNYSGTVQKGYAQPNTKTAVRLFATGHISCGVHIDKERSEGYGSSWHHAISVMPDALDTDGYAFRLIGKMAIRPDGSVGIGTDAAGSGEMLKVTSASTPYINVSDGVHSANFGIDSENTSASTFINASNGARFLANNGVATAISYDDYGSVSLGGAAGSESFRAAYTAASNRWIVATGSNGGNPTLSASDGRLGLASALSLTNQVVGTTVGAAGTASTLPAAPLGYLTVALNGNDVRIPYYN